MTSVLTSAGAGAIGRERWEGSPEREDVRIVTVGAGGESENPEIAGL
jgi:hypothetical protein